MTAALTPGRPTMHDHFESTPLEEELMSMPALNSGDLHEETMSHRRFVSADEYCRLAVSSRQLVRADERALRGLLDPATGVRYLISEQQLLRDAGSRRI